MGPEDLWVEYLALDDALHADVPAARLAPQAIRLRVLIEHDLGQRLDGSLLEEMSVGLRSALASLSSRTRRRRRRFVCAASMSLASLCVVFALLQEVGLRGSLALDLLALASLLTLHLALSLRAWSECNGVLEGVCAPLRTTVEGIADELSRRSPSRTSEAKFAEASGYEIPPSAPTPPPSALAPMPIDLEPPMPHHEPRARIAPVELVPEHATRRKPRRTSAAATMAAAREEVA